MRLFGLASSVLVLAGFATAAGCMPVRLLDAFDDRGAGGAVAGFGGAGGSHDANITSDTKSGSTGAGGGTGITPDPAGFGYLCGGSQATCSPDPGSTDCAPGGNPGMGGAPSDGGATKLACQLIADNGQVVSKCGMAGTAGKNDPCNQATDCQAGYGCGATDLTGVCRQYCCGDPESCPDDTYCTPTKMAESDQQVPLCAPLKSCKLLADAAYCDPGQTCAIVRNNGATSCVTPGTNTEGEPCPCAAGYMCSNATGTCLKLCHLGGTECGSGTCQGGTAPYPPDIGVCVSQ
jgi:hypothetical protein